MIHDKIYNTIIIIYLLSIQLQGIKINRDENYEYVRQYRKPYRQYPINEITERYPSCKLILILQILHIYWKKYTSANPSEPKQNTLLPAFRFDYYYLCNFCLSQHYHELLFLYQWPSLGPHCGLYTRHNDVEKTYDELLFIYWSWIENRFFFPFEKIYTRLRIVTKQSLEWNEIERIAYETKLLLCWIKINWFVSK